MKKVGQKNSSGLFQITLTEEYTVVQTSASSGEEERERFFLWSLTSAALMRVCMHVLKSSSSLNGFHVEAKA